MVVGYIRVSTSRQGEEGISLDEQAHMLRGYADDKKQDLLTIEEDDRLAADARGHLSRPGLQQAIRIAKRNGAAILVPSVDRLVRHPGVLPDLLDAGVPVISVAERRRLGRQTLKALIDRAQRERDLISQRVRQGGCPGAEEGHQAWQSHKSRHRAAQRRHLERRQGGSESARTRRLHRTHIRVGRDDPPGEGRIGELLRASQSRQ